jgi:hypothetical protein
MRRLLVLGGAVLVLAACDSATTAPISLHDGDAASAKAAPRKGGPGGGMTMMSGDCPGTWVRQGGGDSTWVTLCGDEQ